MEEQTLKEMREGAEAAREALKRPAEASRARGSRTRTKPQDFSLPRGILKLIDQLAASEYRNRASLICVAVVEYAKAKGITIPEQTNPVP